MTPDSPSLVYVDSLQSSLTLTTVRRRAGGPLAAVQK